MKLEWKEDYNRWHDLYIDKFVVCSIKQISSNKWTLTYMNNSYHSTTLSMNENFYSDGLDKAKQHVENKIPEWVLMGWVTI